MSTEPETPSSNPAPSTRTVRTYKLRSDAEAAVEILSKAGISASVLDLTSAPHTARTAPNAVRLVVDAEQASRAETLLHSHQRSLKENQTKTETDLQRRERERQRYSRDRQQPKKGFDISAGLFISLALLGAFGVVAYMLSYFLRSNNSSPETALPKPRNSNLDLNGDRKIDLKRYLDTMGRPIREIQDYNYDGIFDAQLGYENGRLTHRSVDLNGDGTWDEFFYYDYLGRLFYSQVIMSGHGGVSKRTYYKEEPDFNDYEWPEEVLGDPKEIPDGGDVWPWLVLTAPKADGVFNHLVEYDSKGNEKSQRDLAPDAPESAAPVFPKRPTAN
jgi:hypothetical protein